ncbi:MAG: HAMP domain-containing sensor histidine kinase [Caulobacteraceae bacterium]|nr:HAMP domain-containing sensor histidine kinase [Caulobacteraceae bacterium]
MTTARRPPTASLFAQLLGLVVLSLVGAIVINLLIILNLTPPMPDFYRVSEVARVLKAGPGTTTSDHRPLVVSLAQKPPGAPKNDMISGGPPNLKRELAQLMGVDPTLVQISAEFGRFSDRRVVRLVRQEMAKDGRPAEEHFLVAPFKVGVRRADGRWVIAEPKPSIVPSAWQQRIILGFFLSTLAVTPIAYLLARRLAAPIALFASAAERLGRDPGAPPLALRGPAEIRTAVGAFNDMQERLARYVDDRTAMVGAIAHDLRTPLTRLRFRVESAPEELRAKMAADIGEMEAMVAGTLAFVRDATHVTTRTPLELSSLLESLADDMSETGLNVVVERAERVVVDGDPLALRRLFNNLLDNAVKFGCLARVRVFADDGFAVVEIEDRGHGLPEKELDRVFEPFYRREASRSRETGGIGLGLAVVRSIARAHGGDATLGNRDGGGAVARVRLPI